MSTRKSVLGLGLVGLLAASSASAGEWPAPIGEIKSEKGKVVAVKGDLAKGQMVEDLRFAADSSVACFPATQNEKFRGNHVFYFTELPRRSIMNITVVPDDPKANLSIYAYSMGMTDTYLPPKVPSVVSCEADHKWDRPWKGKTQDHTRSVRLNAINNPYRVVIAVVGPKGVVKGGYTLKVDVQ